MPFLICATYYLQAAQFQATRLAGRAKMRHDMLFIMTRTARHWSHTDIQQLIRHAIHAIFLQRGRCFEIVAAKVLSVALITALSPPL